MTNWYIRFNRKRLKGTAGLGVEDTVASLNTLFQVLFTLVRALAPFTPFITEHIYGLLKPCLGDAVQQFKDSRSVHFLPFPTADDALLDQVIERKVAAMQKVIELGRAARERGSLPLKAPLLTLVVVADAEILADVESLKSYVEEELNIKEVTLTTDEAKYNILLEARVDWPTLGKRLKKDVQIVRKALPSLSQDQLRGYLEFGQITIHNIQLSGGDLSIVRTLARDTSKLNDDGTNWEPAFAEDMVVLLDPTPHPELADEGLAREIVNRFQRLRRKAVLIPTDDVQMEYQVVANPDGVEVQTVVSTRQEWFNSSLRGRLEAAAAPGATSTNKVAILEEVQDVGSLTLLLRLVEI